MGSLRLPFCAELAQRTARPGEINYHFFDAFSLAHLAVGVGLGWLGLGMWPTLAIAIGWEFFEHLMKDCAPFLFVFSTQDTLLNAAGDVAVTMLGWLLTRIVREQWTARDDGEATLDDTDATPGYGRTLLGDGAPAQASRVAAMSTSRTSSTFQPIRPRRRSSFCSAATSS